MKMVHFQFFYNSLKITKEFVMMKLMQRVVEI